jgi:uncharacterized protein (DUF1684 family)
LKPDGWLSLTGLEWLQAGDNSIGSAADNKIHLAGGGPAHLAILHLEGESVTLNAPAGGFPPDFLVAGSPAKQQPLRAEANNDKVSPHLTIGTLNMYVIRREGRFALRIKDSHSPSIVGFHGLKWFAPNAAYRHREGIPTLVKTITLATLVGTSYDNRCPGPRNSHCRKDIPHQRSPKIRPPSCFHPARHHQHQDDVSRLPLSHWIPTNGLTSPAN